MKMSYNQVDHFLDFVTSDILPIRSIACLPHGQTHISIRDNLNPKICQSFTKSRTEYSKYLVLGLSGHTTKRRMEM